jgi:hypothetical protein
MRAVCFGQHYLQVDGAYVGTTPLDIRPYLLLAQCDHQHARTETVDRKGAQQPREHQWPIAEMSEAFRKACLIPQGVLDSARRD